MGTWTNTHEISGKSSSGVKPCPESGSCLCTGGWMLPEIRGIFLPGVHKRAWDSGQTYAQGAETCLRFGADLCTVGYDVSEISGRVLQELQNLPMNQGIKMQGMQNLQRDSVQTFAGYAMRQTRFRSDNCRVGMVSLNGAIPPQTIRVDCQYTDC